MKHTFFVATFILCLACPVHLMAQDGKLLGRVLDKESGKPVKGASVVVVGTTLTAVTAVNGEYTITRIPPDVYAVVVASIGYTPLMIYLVRVESTITTTLDFQLGKEPPVDHGPYDQAPEPTKQVTPKYPDLATKAGIEGTVWTRVEIDERGKVTNATVLKSDAQIFNQSAIEAAMQWEFKPAMMKGKPVATWVSIPFRYKLF